MLLNCKLEKLLALRSGLYNKADFCVVLTGFFSKCGMIKARFNGN